MDSNRLHTAIMLVLGWVIGTLITFPPVISATPSGGEVVAGSATIGVSPSNPQHQIITQTTPKTIINWDSFNIDVGQTTQFVQPSSSAISLNRVIGADPSVILGNLRANGQVWVINPAGILFGPTAKVDVAGLLATTANISNQDFMSGNYHFLQPPDKATTVINQGHITVKEAGMAALVAPSVKNSGVIEANLGKVVLASGTQYTLDLYGDELINFAVSQPQLPRSLAGAEANIFDTEGRPIKEAVSSAGRLIANGGKILLTTGAAGQVVKNLINMNGVIEANAVGRQAGKIVLRAAGEGSPGEATIKVAGRIQARGEKPGELGGEIVITGERGRIGLFSEGPEKSAYIDASGMAGGGKVLVGGGEQGQNRDEIPWADAVFMGKGTQIHADALAIGNGGTTVLRSKDCIRFHGDMSVKGGGEEGKGGLGELSANWVESKGKLDIGKGGKYLLDPWDVLILDAVQQDGDYALAPGGLIWIPSGPASLVNLTELRDFLDANVNVEIQTATGMGADPGQAGNINLAAPIFTVANGATLTLRASNDITFNADLTGNAGAGLNLVLIAPGAVTGMGAVNVAALQLNVGTIDIGYPDHAGVNPAGSLSFVSGNNTGSNITLLNTFGPGTHFFNGNDLFQYLPPAPPPPPTPIPSPSPVSTPSNAITSALDPSNFAPINPATPTSDTQSSIIDNQTASSPPSSTSASESAAPASPPPPPPPASEAPPPPEAPTAAPATAPEPVPAPVPEAAAPMPSSDASSYAADVPNATDFICGGAEGREIPQTAEGEGGQEGFAKEPEAVEKTEEVLTPCPVNIEKTDKPVPPNCPEKPSGPLSPDSLTNTEVGPDSQIAQELKQRPIGPEGVGGVDVPIGADGIGGGSFDQEQVKTAEGAEGNESLAAKYGFSPEDIDRSPEYRENLGPTRPENPPASSRRPPL